MKNVIAKYSSVHKISKLTVEEYIMKAAEYMSAVLLYWGVSKIKNISQIKVTFHHEKLNFLDINVKNWEVLIWKTSMMI